MLMIAIVTLGAVALTACNTKDSDTIVVGLECGYIPFNFTQKTDANGAIKIDNAEGYANGYDIQIAKKIAD